MLPQKPIPHNSTSEPVLKSEFSFLDLATTHTTLTSAQRVLTKPQLGKIRPKYFVALSVTLLRRFAFRLQSVPSQPTRPFIDSGQY